MFNLHSPTPTMVRSTARIDRAVIPHRFVSFVCMCPEWTLTASFNGVGLLSYASMESIPRAETSDRCQAPKYQKANHLREFVLNSRHPDPRRVWKGGPEGGLRDMAGSGGSGGSGESGESGDEFPKTMF